MTTFSTTLTLPFGTILNQLLESAGFLDGGVVVSDPGNALSSDAMTTIVTVAHGSVGKPVKPNEIE